MQTREYPVLSPEDHSLLERVALGTDEAAASVLGYLLLRGDEPAFADDPATRLAIRVGTGESRSAVADALSTLDDRGLVASTTVDRDRSGRPPRAWRARADVRETLDSLYASHAADLLAQAVSVVGETWTTALDPDAFAGSTPAGGSLVLGLNWRPNVLHAPLLAAGTEGRFAAHDLTVDVRPFEGSGRAVEALLADEVDVAVAGAATTVGERTAGSPLVPLAPVYQRAMTVLYTTSRAFGGPFDSVEDLRGRRVGLPEGSEMGLLGRLFLSQSGLLEDVSVVDVAGEEREALREGAADVVTGTFRDPRALPEDAAIDVLALADHFPLYGPTLVTTEEAVEERPGELVAFLAGVVGGQEVVLSDPERAVRAVEGAVSDGPRETETGRAVADLREAVERFGASGAVDDHGWGWQRPDEWRRLTTALRQTGLVGGRV
jgi:ABC-type nitrate/sulfonate/bicarbonate transport system substrate-binding protein